MDCSSTNNNIKKNRMAYLLDNTTISDDRPNKKRFSEKGLNSNFENYDYEKGSLIDNNQDEINYDVHESQTYSIKTNQTTKYNLAITNDLNGIFNFTLYFWYWHFFLTVYIMLTFTMRVFEEVDQKVVHLILIGLGYAGEFSMNSV